jgi:hypothetical protein
MLYQEGTSSGRYQDLDARWVNIVIGSIDVGEDWSRSSKTNGVWDNHAGIGGKDYFVARSNPGTLNNCVERYSTLPETIGELCADKRRKAEFKLTNHSWAPIL